MNPIDVEINRIHKMLVELTGSKRAARKYMRIAKRNGKQMAKHVMNGASNKTPRGLFSAE